MLLYFEYLLVYSLEPFVIETTPRDPVNGLESLVDFD